MRGSAQGGDGGRGFLPGAGAGPREALPRDLRCRAPVARCGEAAGIAARAVGAGGAGSDSGEGGRKGGRGGGAAWRCAVGAGSRDGARGVGGSAGVGAVRTRAAGRLEGGSARLGESLGGL